VLFVTADDNLVNFAAECGASVEGVLEVATVHVHAMDRAFANDREHGGNRIYEAAQRTKVNKFCGAMLSAEIMHALVVGPALGSKSEGGGEDSLRQSLKEAVALLADLRPLLECASGGGEQRSERRAAAAAKAVERVDEATRRWQALLSRRSP